MALKRSATAIREWLASSAGPVTPCPAPAGPPPTRPRSLIRTWDGARRRSPGPVRRPTHSGGGVLGVEDVDLARQKFITEYVAKAQANEKALKDLLKKLEKLEQDRAAAALAANAKS